MSIKNKKTMKTTVSKGTVIGILFFSVLLIVILMFGLPTYNVWQQEMAGKAEMAKAEQNRKILIEEARARLEAEKLNAQAEIERAKGMAEAMKIENGTLNTVYNQYLFIRTLEKLADKGNLPQIIYMPSDGLVPVMDVSQKKQN
jgi:regulator of protease activity HflC (stomatin/prohibitin superfamily)